MKKILLICGHPDLKESIANRAIIEAILDKLNADLHNIAMEYQNGKFDIKREQNLIKKYDVLFFQYPIYWCSMPGILKEWIDKIFLHDFAYGDRYELKDKDIYQSVTLAGQDTKESKINVLQKMMFTIQGLAKHCKMNYCNEFVLYEMNYQKESNQDYFKRKAIEHANKIIYNYEQNYQRN